MPRPDDFSYQPLPYEHVVFPVGTQIYVDPSIRAIHSAHDAAGQVGTVCASVYYPVLDLLESRSHETYVPVLLAGGQVFLVEEEYVSVYQTEAEVQK